MARHGNDKDLTKNKIISIIGIVLLGPLVFLLIYIYDHNLILFIVLFSTLCLILGTIFIRFIILMSKKRKRAKIARESRLFLQNQREENELTREFIFSENDRLTLSQQNLLHERVSVKLEPYTYHGEIQNKLCKITRNAFKKDDEIIQCPECLSLYHKKYLIEWLLRKNVCPVCGKKPFKL